MQMIPDPFTSPYHQCTNDTLRKLTHNFYHLYSHLLLLFEYKHMNIGQMWLDTSESGVY